MAWKQMNGVSDVTRRSQCFKWPPFITYSLHCVDSFIFQLIRLTVEPPLSPSDITESIEEFYSFKQRRRSFERQSWESEKKFSSDLTSSHCFSVGMADEKQVMMGLPYLLT